MSDHDPTATIEDAEYLQQLIPNSDLQIIEGCRSLAAMGKARRI